MQSLEVQLNQALAKIEFYESLVVSLRSQIHQDHLKQAQVELEERIVKLPPDAKERLRKAFPSTDLGGLRQAIKAERSFRKNHKVDDRVDRILGTDDREIVSNDNQHLR